jgi:hypothetical protein
MIARSRLNNENGRMINFLGFDINGLDKSSPYINIGRLDKSSPYIKKKMGLMSQAFRELTIFPGGIK